MDLPNQSNGTWLDLEQSICTNLQISDLPFCSSTIKKHPCFKALTIGSTLTAWWKFHSITNTKPSPSRFTPIWNNHKHLTFAPGETKASLTFSHSHFTFFTMGVSAHLPTWSSNLASPKNTSYNTYRLKHQSNQL